MDFRAQGSSGIYLNRLRQVLEHLDLNSLDEAINLIYSAWQNNKQIIVFGNGGSALTAQHYITDWNKSIYMATEKPFLGRCLADNLGLITAYSNDVSYQDVFLEQLKPLLIPGDLVIGISGSGNSENVLRAIRYAREHGGITLGICGYDGGKLKKEAEYHFCAEVPDMQLSEDVHFFFGHIVMQKLCGYLDSKQKLKHPEGLMV